MCLVHIFPCVSDGDSRVSMEAGEAVTWDLLVAVMNQQVCGGSPVHLLTMLIGG